MAAHIGLPAGSGGFSKPPSLLLRTLRAVRGPEGLWELSARANDLTETLGSGEHGVTIDTEQGQDLVILDSDRLFMHFVTLSFPVVEPSLRADAPWEPVVRRAGKEHAKGEAVMGQILAGNQRSGTSGERVNHLRPWGLWQTRQPTK